MIWSAVDVVDVVGWLRSSELDASELGLEDGVFLFSQIRHTSSFRVSATSRLSLGSKVSQKAAPLGPSMVSVTGILTDKRFQLAPIDSGQ